MVGHGEFDLIAGLFAPLAASNPGALGLTDDAALLDISADCQAVTTVDAMVEGVHFLGADAADLVGQKLLRVNLSDLAAMGAKPLCYLLTLVRPQSTSEEWLQRFARGLANDQRTFGIALAGGDTVSTPGPLVLSLTAIGVVQKNQAIRRSGAQPGDDLWVSGTIGDAALGLALVQGSEKSALADLSQAERNFLVARLQRPEPRLALGQGLIGLATAAVDISDGLIADVGHLADASKVNLELDLSALPLSGAARHAVGERDEEILNLMTGGEDYELAFTAPAAEAKRIKLLADKLKLSVSKAGKVTEAGNSLGGAVLVTGTDGEVLPVKSTGWTHF